MAALISIDRNLVVRFGHTTYQFNNFLDDRRTVVFQNQATGEFKQFTLSDFVSKVETGVLVPVLGDSQQTLLGPDGKPIAAVLDVSALPEKAQDDIELRHICVRWLRKKGITKGQRSKVAKAAAQLFDHLDRKNAEENKPPVVRCSTSTLMGWMRRYEASARNVVSLMSGNHARRRPRTIHDEVEKAMDWALDTFYLKRTRLSLKYAYERLVDRLTDRVAQKKIKPEEAKISMATFHRRKDELDPFMVTTRRYGPARANHDFRATIDGTQIRRAMARLEVDHTLLNWVVVCDRTGLPLGRPTLTIIIDSHSGYLVGMYVSFNGPGLTSVLNVIKNSIRPKDTLVAAAGAVKPWIAWGIGDCFLLDNGMEFHSKVFRLAAWELCTDIEYCRVRTPWLKPKVERTFADLDYLPLVHGRVHKPMANVLNINPQEDAAITLSKLCQGLVIFATDIHGYERNSRTGALPVELYGESIAQSPPPQMPVSMAGLDLIAAMSKSLMISHGGADFYGLSYAGYELSELLRSAGGKFRTLVKWNPDDMGAMYVQHPRTKEWVTLHCTRADYASGLSFNQHRLIGKVARATYASSGNIEHLLASKRRLSELWMEPLAKKNHRLDFAQSKAYAKGMASASGLEPIENAPLAVRTILAPEEIVVEERDIPSFETFTMN